MNIIVSESESGLAVGNCSGCNQHATLLFKIPNAFRYQCAECFQKELGYRHYLDPRPYDDTVKTKCADNPDCDYPAREGSSHCGKEHF